MNALAPASSPLLPLAAPVVVSTEFGRLVTRPATEKDVARRIEEELRAAREVARVEGLRAEYRALRAEGVERRARYNAADYAGCSRWTIARSPADFDAACRAHALRALSARDPMGYEYQSDRARSATEYVLAAREIVATAREDAEIDRASQSRDD